MHGLRATIRRQVAAPGPALAAVATIAVAIAAATAIFGVLDAVVLRPLPFPESERAVVLCETAPRTDGFCVASPPNVADWARASRTIESFGLARTWPFALESGEERESLHGGVATPDFFRVLRAHASLGRLFGTTDMAPGDDRVAVLSEAFWQRRFGGDPTVVGRSLSIDGRPVAVVGVLAHAPPAEFASVDLWMPLTSIQDDVTNRGWRGFTALGRLAAGATLAQAREEMALLRDRLAEANPETNRDWGVAVLRYRDWIAGPVESTLWMLFAAVSVLLLIACVNVANLLLVQADRRRAELAVRAALGATGGQLARQLVGEASLLAAAGGILGTLLAGGALAAFRRLAPPSLPRLAEVAMDGRVLAAAILCTLATAFLCSLLPAVRASRGDLAPVLRGARSAGSRGRLGSALVVAEIALAFALLAVTALLGRGFARLAGWQPGFDPTRVATAWLAVSPGAVRTGDEAVATFERAASALVTVHGVEAIGLSSAGPVFGGVETAEARPDDQAQISAAPFAVRWFDVSPGYFATLGVALLRGRDFAASDRRETVPVAICNRAFADRAWPGAEAVGRRIRVNDAALEIVGVVENVRPLRPDVDQTLEIYWPQRQRPRWGTFLVLRLAPGAPDVGRAVSERLRQVDPDLRQGAVAPLSGALGRELARPRFVVLLAGAFAGVALLLASLGTYGVVAHSVASRTREIGVRLALGARTRRVILEVVRRGMGLVAIGLVLGAVAAVAAATALRSLLFGISALEPVALAATVALFLLVALAACAIPAVRAARVDPVRVLRGD